MEENKLPESIDCHVMALHDIARKLENSHISRDTANKIRAVADELYVEIITSKRAGQI